MPINVPAYDTSQFSFGPGRIFVGPTGSTPTEDVGGITEDGITFDLQSEKRTISQGNPRTPIYVFSQAQGVMINFTGIEWDFDDFSRILGSGTTDSSGGVDTFAFGGEPCVTELALSIEHYMCSPGHTMDIRVWRAASENGMSFTLGQDEHQFPNSYMALRATTNWAGDSLPYDQQLIQMARTT